MSLNFSYGIIAIVGVLAAITIGFIAVSPDYIPEPRIVEEKEKSIVPVLPISLTVSLPMGSGVPGCDETNECFLPYEETVAKGATVTWSNDDSAAHTVTSELLLVVQMDYLILVYSWQEILLNLLLMMQELMITSVWFILGWLEVLV